MATSLGMLTCFDSDRQYVSTVGQDVVYDAINTELARHNETVRQSMNVFVDKKTDLHSARYLAPIGGYMDTMGRQAAASAIKRTGHWDVAFPLIQVGNRISTDRVDRGYLTAGQLEGQLKGIFTRDRNAVRRSMLSAIFVDTARVYADPIWGNLTIQPLANNDATVFPPVIGNDTGAIDNHYLAMNVINAANFLIARDELLEHFGWDQSGYDVVVLCDPTSSLAIQALAGFLAYPLAHTSHLNVAATWSDYPVPDAPGLTVGVYQGCFINEWRWMPTDYLIFVHMDEPSPLYMRRDPADTGLGSGLQLVQTDTEHPITNIHYEHRFGFGCSNRLNGVVWNVAANYAVPTVPINYNQLRYASA